MALREYDCPNCGSFERINNDHCPKCGEVCVPKISAPARIIVNHKENQMLGTKSPGKYIPAQNGKPSVFVPSFGLMEQAEVDYIAEGALEKPMPERANKKRMETVTTKMMNAPRGERYTTGLKLGGKDG